MPVEPSEPLAPLPPDREATGQALVDAFAASPHRDVEIEADGSPMPVRDPPWCSD